MIDRQRPLAKSSDLSPAPRHSFLITSSSLERGAAIKEKGKPFIYTLQSFNFSEVFTQSSFIQFAVFCFDLVFFFCFSVSSCLSALISWKVYLLAACFRNSNLKYFFSAITVIIFSMYL